MATLKEIKRRIVTVHSIRNVTSAIQKIAAVRLVKARNRVTSVREYVRAQEGILAMCLRQDVDHALMQPNGSHRKLLVVLTSDKGLCGGFNTRILERTVAFLEEHGHDHVQVMVVGRKGVDFLTRSRKKVSMAFKMMQVPVFCPLSYISDPAGKAVEMILSGEIGEIHICYPEFAAVGRQPVVVKRVVPVQATGLPLPAGVNPDIHLYEPEPQAIVDGLLPEYVRLRLWLALLEEIVSEQAARMVAMERAVHNAEEMINTLTLTRNKIRQGAITKELADIVGTVDALG